MNKSELESRIALAKDQLKTARKMRLSQMHIRSIKGYLAAFEAELEAVA